MAQFTGFTCDDCGEIGTAVTHKTTRFEGPHHDHEVTQDLCLDCVASHVESAVREARQEDLTPIRRRGKKKAGDEPQDDATDPHDGPAETLDAPDHEPIQPVSRNAEIPLG